MLKQLLPFCHPIHVRSLGPLDLASTSKEMKAVDPKGLHTATELMEERPNPTFVGDSHQQGNLENMIPNQWLFNCDLKTISITWELARNAQLC